MRPMAQRRSTITVLAVLALVGLAVAATGCGGKSAGNGGQSTGNGKKGGTITLSYYSEPSSLDPAIAWNVIDWSVEHCIFQSFLQYDPKPGMEGTKLIPCLATEVPSTQNGGISADGKTYTFHLKHGIKFQPPISREVTAQDFKYSIERVLDPKTTPVPPGQSFYLKITGAKAFNSGKAKDVTGITTPDNYTVQIHLDSPDLSFLNAVTMEFCDVIPKEWVDQWGKNIGHHPLGTGPYMFVSWKPGQEIALKRNPNYWDPSHVWADEIDYMMSFNPSTALLKLQRGEVDALGDNVPPSDIVRIKHDPTWSKYLVSQPLIAISYLYMDVLSKPFDNVKVRQAVSWAIDRDKLVKLQAGQAVPLYQVYPPGMPGYQEGVKYYGYDPAKAKALLAQAGFANGFKTQLYTDNVDPDPKLMQSVQNDLAAVGIQADLRTMSNNAYYTFQGQPGKSTMGSFGWWMDYPDPSDWIGPLFSKASAVAGGMNSSFWWSPQLEQMFTEAQAMTDPQTRLAKYDDMQKYILDQAPYATLYAPIETTMCSKTLGGFYLHPVYELDPAHYWKQ
jgi:oligopeptide transport system substrate-binding protein